MCRNKHTIECIQKKVTISCIERRLEDSFKIGWRMKTLKQWDLIFFIYFVCNFWGSACAFNESLNGNSTHPIHRSITPSSAQNSLTERLKLRTIAGEAHSSERESERRELCANTSTRRVHEDGTGSPRRFNGLFYCSYSFTSACTTRASHTNVLRSRARFFPLWELSEVYTISQTIFDSHKIFDALTLPHSATHSSYIFAHMAVLFHVVFPNRDFPLPPKKLHNGMFVREYLLRNGIKIPLRKNFNFFFDEFRFPLSIHPQTQMKLIELTLYKLCKSANNFSL